MEALGYENLPLVSAYIDRILTPDNMLSPITASPAWNPYALYRKIQSSAAPAYWEQAKMMLLMCSVKDLSPAYQKSFVLRIPEEHIDSGKLLCDLAMSMTDKEKQKYLIEAVEAGHEPAMNILYHYVKNSPTPSALQPLIHQLYPKACIQIGNTFADKLSSTASLTSASFQNAMFYYKLAASAKSLEALDKIAALSYNLFVAPHITQKGFLHNDKISSVCDQLIPICQHLVAEKHFTLDNNCRLGTMLCYRRKNYSAAAQALSGKSDPLTQFCKGAMYEYGNYYAKDLKKAKELYRASMIPAAAAALQRVSRQIEKEEAEKKEAAAHSYSESETYSSSTSSSSSGGGFCFITTAACMALQGEDHCPELMLLRAFRDNNLRSNTEGSELVEEYYRIGPKVVEKLNALPNKQEEYLALWDRYIGPSCRLIQNQRLDEARDLYIAMVVSLCSRFQIPVNTAGFPSLRESLKAKGLPIENL